MTKESNKRCPHPLGSITLGLLRVVVHGIGVAEHPQQSNDVERAHVATRGLVVENVEQSEGELARYFLRITFGCTSWKVREKKKVHRCCEWHARTSTYDPSMCQFPSLGSLLW